MMIPLMGKTEFAERVRDPRLAYDNYVAKAENLVARIPNAAKKIGDAQWLCDADPGMLMSMTAARSEYALDLLHLSYSAGLEPAVLQDAFPEVVNYFEEYAHYSEKYNDAPEGCLHPGPHIAIRDAEFSRANRLFCFAILLGWTRLVPRIMAVIEYNNDQLDGMLERLAAVYIPRPEPFPSDCTRHLPYSRTLPVFDAGAAGRSERMKTYLDGWYESSKREPYYASHARGRHYLGYWSWEAGAISLALNIDDQPSRAHEYYPRDMVEFGKSVTDIDAAL